MGKVSKSLKARKTTRKNKPSCTNSYTDLGGKQVAVSDYKENEGMIMVERGGNSEPAALYSPLRSTDALLLPKTPCSKSSFHCSTPVMANDPVGSPWTLCSQGRLSNSPSALANLMKTPRTPCTPLSACSYLFKTPNTTLSQETSCDSRLESLPTEMLVKVLCHLHHDQLKPAFHVSRRIREAVILARQWHFNFTTPDRRRQELLNTTTPKTMGTLAFVKQMNRKACPRTPKPTRHISRTPPKFNSADVCQIADALFQESAFSSRCASSSTLPRSISKSNMAPHRVLFYNDEFNSSDSWF